MAEILRRRVLCAATPDLPFRSTVSATLAMAILFVCACLGTTRCLAGETSAITTAYGQRALMRSNQAALQADGRQAAAALAGVPRNHFVGSDIRYRRCMLKRFGHDAVAPGRPATGDAFVSDVLHLYQTYWWHALMSPRERDERGAQLQRGLSSLLGERTTIQDWDVLDARVAGELRERGYHSQLGITPPLRELMIWREQQSSLHEVELPEGSFAVRLEMLNDFVTRGWNAYARCDRSSNAGWATKDRLYAVGPVFSKGMDNDAFRASLLGHETQHFADFTRFPKLEMWEMEYRAKLTELWLARDSRQSLLSLFHHDQCDDKGVPHLFANRRVMHDLHSYLAAEGVTSRADLLDVPPEKLQAAAREVLLRDSRHRAGIAGMAVLQPGPETSPP